ncbi:UNVERIFIED_CONTAM: putative ABC transporter ATP-binding protein [Trichonephila clavipes]
MYCAEGMREEIKGNRRKITIIDSNPEQARAHTAKNIHCLQSGALFYRASTSAADSLFHNIATPAISYMIPNLRKNIVESSIARLLDQDSSYHQNNFSGSFANKVNDLANYVPDIMQIMADRVMGRALALGIGIYFLWQVNISFALLMLTWSALFVLSSLFLAKRITRLADAWSELGSSITGKMVDVFSNIMSVRLFASKYQEKLSLLATHSEAVKAEQKLQWLYTWIFTFYGFLFLIMQILNLYFLIRGRGQGSITIGDFAFVMNVNIAIANFLWVIAKDFSQFSKSWGRITQALRTISVIPEIQDQPNAADLVIKKGEISFDKVHFHYKDVEPIFENKSIIIESGQRVGLVGYSGGGKSTFVNLILRLYDVKSGKISIDGQDIRDVTQDSLHRNIGMIPQDPSLFHRTLMENIRYGRADASDDEVIEAAKRAHAHEFISKLPQGYESLVGERGVKLSGGQRQRIAIARAILKNAPILILDEATSALDTPTEQLIQESLNEVLETSNATTIIIAHRLSTLLHMDRILVLDQGKIVEDGMHQELLDKNGMYKTLLDAQVGGFLLDKKEVSVQGNGLRNDR